MVVAASPPASPPPGGPPPGSIEEQLTLVIARGFNTVLSDVRAMHQEMLHANRTMMRSADLVARRMEEASKAMATGGLSSPSGMSVREAEARANRAKATVAAAKSQNQILSQNRVAEALKYEDPDLGIGGGADAYATARGKGVSGLRGMVARGIESRATSYLEKDAPVVDRAGVMYRRPDDKLVYDAASGKYKHTGMYYDTVSGRWRHPNGSFATHAEYDQYRMLRPNGYHLNKQGQWVHTATGRFAQLDEVRAATPGYAQAQRFARRAQVAGGIKDAMASWSQGDTTFGRALLNTLPTETATALGAGAGVAAGTYTAIRSAFAKSQDMWREGREYANIYGGSAAEGFKESLKKKIGMWGAGFNFFGPGGAEYGELFDSGASLGLRGGSRDRYIGQGIDMMEKGKISAKEASGLMRTAITTGQSVYGLSEALVTLNKAARLAGVSAAVAKEQFASIYETISSSPLYEGRNSAKTAATAMAVANTQLGQEGQANGVTYTGGSNLGLIVYHARQAGMTPDEYITSGRSLAQDTEKDVRRRVNQMGGKGRSGMLFGDFVANFAKKNPGFSLRTHRMQLLEAVSAEHFAGGSFFVRIVGVLAAFGMKFNASDTESINNAVIAAAGLFLPNGSAGQVEKAMTEQARQELALKPGADGRLPDGGLSNKDMPGTGQTQKDAVKVFFNSSDQHPTGGTLSLAQKALTAYPVAQKFFNDVTSDKYGWGMDAWKKLKFQVQTKGGARVVGLKDLLIYYPDQIQSGTAVMVEGPEELRGKPISEIYGFSQDDTAITGGRTPFSASSNTTYGDDWSSWVKDHPEYQGGVTTTSGTTTVTLGNYNGIDVTLTINAKVDQSQTNLDANNDRGG